MADAISASKPSTSPVMVRVAKRLMLYGMPMTTCGGSALIRTRADWISGGSGVAVGGGGSGVGGTSVTSGTGVRGVCAVIVESVLADRTRMAIRARLRRRMDFILIKRMGVDVALYGLRHQVADRAAQSQALA